MRGVCISFQPRNVGTIWPDPAPATTPVYAVPLGVSPFCFFFRPVFPYLRDLYWFASHFQSTPFIRLLREDGGEERLDRAQMDVLPDDVNCVLHRPGTLPELAPYLANDDITLVGMYPPEDHVVRAAGRLASASDDFDRIACGEAELAFACMDGFWWEFYSRDPSLLGLVTRPLEGVAGLGLRECDLLNRRALFEDSAGG